MELNGERLLPVDRQRAWEALNDIALLQQCIPGCQSMTRTGPDQYAAVVNAAVGPVKTRFQGSFSLADIVVPTGYTLRFEGNGGATGFARGQAQVSLEDRGAAQTLLRYRATAQVGGKLAQIGSRLVDAAAGAMADKFFAAFAQQLAPPAGAAVQAGAAPSMGLWGTIAAFLRRLFGRA